jgi:hypothetical protein
VEGVGVCVTFAPRDWLLCLTLKGGWPVTLSAVALNRREEARQAPGVRAVGGLSYSVGGLSTNSRSPDRIR